METTPAVETNAMSTWTESILLYYASYPWIGLLLLMMAIDILSGVTAAIYQRKLSSKIGYRGMMKKASVLLVIGMAAIIEQAFKVTLPDHLRNSVAIPLAKLTAGFFLFNEGLSVLENAKRAGVPLPSFLSKSLVDTIDRISGGRIVDKTNLTLKEVKLEAIVERDKGTPIIEPPSVT